MDNQTISTKILRYKNNGNDIEMVNKKLILAYGNVYFNDSKSYDDEERKNYYVLSDDKKFAYPLIENTRLPQSQILESLTQNNYSQKTTCNFFDSKITNNGYINNLDILFAENCGKNDLVVRMRNYKNNWHIEKNQRELKEHQAKEKQEELENQEKLKAKELKKQNDIKTAYEKIKNQKKLTATEFELLCNIENIKLPIKFLGWLREHCGSIKIENHKSDISEYVVGTNSYYTSYMYNKGHKSTSIYKYADMLGNAVSL